VRLTVPAGRADKQQKNPGGKTSHFREGKKMKRKKILVIAVLALAMTTMAAAPAIAGRGGRGGAMGGGMRGGPAMGRGAMPTFTEEQQEKIQEIRSSFDEDRVELANRIKVMHLEMRELITGDNPDFGKLERMIDDISKERAEMMKIGIRQHVAVRKILTDDQKVLFDQSFGMRMSHAGMVGSMGGPGVMGGRPGGGRMGGRGGMGI
jgi:Spy/CpxP family protein refolding chaperone